MEPKWDLSSLESAFKIVFDDPANMVAVTIIRTWGIL
jgi:hypothetical protein